MHGPCELKDASEDRNDAAQHKHDENTADVI